MDVSIIIVNYNTMQLTKNCIDSIVEYTKNITIEIIVVDNNSTDESIEELSNDNRICFIESGYNLGFGRANNLGLNIAKGKYIFFLNSDTILLNNAIKIMFDFMEENSHKLRIGALGTILLDENHNKNHSFASFPKIGKQLYDEWADHIIKIFGKKIDRLDRKIQIDPNMFFFPVDYVTGADILVRKDVLDQYGAFDPSFFMYYE